MTIPVGNVYFLLLYAWRHAQRQALVEVGDIGKTDMLNLVAHLFVLEVKRLLTRGLSREYQVVEEEIAGIRGRVDLGTTIKRDLLRRGRTWCQYDELSYDVPRNRILKATLRQLLRVPELDAENRESARQLYSKMHEVREVPLKADQLRLVQVHRLVRDYEFALRLAALVCTNVVLEKGGSGARFVDFREDEATMHQLFEDFVFSFYAIERPEWRPRRKTILWFNAFGTGESLRHLPKMHTDVTLSLEGREVIVDAKFYQNPLSGRYDERVQSDNLYQLYAYVGNAQAMAPNVPHEGILLYAATDRAFDFRYRLNEHSIAVTAVDLRQDWRSIHENMLNLVAHRLELKRSI
jgi:5-methylcytosine-specific restriction enzyme subunit McrC